MRPTAIVTGATGYVGNALTRELIKQGWLARPSSRYLQIDSQWQWLRDNLGSLEDDSTTSAPSANNAVFENVDTVYHLAGIAHQHHSVTAAQYQRANVDYSKSVAMRCAHAGVKRLVFLSSIAAVGERTIDTPLTPESQPSPQTRYGESKLAAETAIREVCEASTTKAVIVRAPLIYGANAKGNLATLVRASRFPIPLPLPATDNRRSMLGLTNLVDLLEQCGHENSGFEHRTLMPRDVDWSTGELTQAIRHSLGKNHRALRIPDSVWNLISQLPIIGRRARVMNSSLQQYDSWLEQESGWQAKTSWVDEIQAMIGST